MRKNKLKAIIAAILLTTFLGEINLYADEISNSSVESTVQLKEYKVTMPSEISASGEAGAEVEIPITISDLPNDKEVKSVEIVIDTPKEYDVKDVTIDKNLINAENISYNNSEEAGEFNKLRIAIINTTKNPITVSALENSAVLGNLKLSLKNASTSSNSQIKVSKMIFRCVNDEDLEYDVSGGITSIKYIKEALKIEPRVLYKGDIGSVISSISGSNTVMAVEFTNFPEDISGLQIKVESTPLDLYYSEELSKKNNKLTYVGNSYTSESFAMLVYSNWDKYVKHYKSEQDYVPLSITFGDEKKDGIDAQDALEAVNLWLRKSKYNSINTIIYNVNGDGDVNTRDAVDIVDNYVSGKEFKILSK